MLNLRNLRHVTISCLGFLSHSKPEGFGTTPWYSFIRPSINLKLRSSIGMKKTTQTQKKCWSVFMTSFLIFATSLFFVVFCSNFAQRCSLVLQKILKVCWDWLQNDITMTSSMISRTPFYQIALQRMCFNGSIKYFFLLTLCTEVPPQLALECNFIRISKTCLGKNMHFNTLFRNYCVTKNF